MTALYAHTINAEGRFIPTALRPSGCRWMQGLTLPAGALPFIKSFIGDELGLTWQQQRDMSRELGCQAIDIRGIVPNSVAIKKMATGDVITSGDCLNISNPKLDEDHSLADALEAFREAGLPVASAASAITNFGVPFDDATVETQQLRQFEYLMGIMKQWDIPFVRTMSWKIPAGGCLPTEVLVKRLKPFVAMAEQAGVIMTHENCKTNGALRWQNSFELAERLDSLFFQLCFDTGNQEEYAEPGNDSWAFWDNTRILTAYVHVKDGIRRLGAGPGGSEVMEYTLPGRGNGQVERVLTDALQRGYIGLVTQEPHTAFVFHKPGATATFEQISAAARAYNQEFDALLARIWQQVKAGQE